MRNHLFGVEVLIITPNIQWKYAIFQKDWEHACARVPLFDRFKMEWGAGYLMRVNVCCAVAHSGLCSFTRSSIRSLHIVSFQMDFTSQSAFAPTSKQWFTLWALIIVSVYTLRLPHGCTLVPVALAHRRRRRRRSLSRRSAFTLYRIASEEHVL